MKNQELAKELQSLNVDGAKYKTKLSRKFNMRKPYEPSSPGKVFAFIPGTIRKVFVKEGDMVKKGDSLLTLEAMKMNNLVVASSEGIIKTLHVKSGEVVSNKQLLVEIEGS